MRDTAGRQAQNGFPLMNSDQAHDSPVPERLRIAFVVDRFGNRFGGAEAYGVELMRELAEKHEITGDSA